MNRLLFIFILLLLNSCNRSPASKEFLSEDLMVAILIDVQVAEGKASTLPISYDSSKVLYHLLEKDIFLKHGVSDSVFTTSMAYYLEDAEKMDRIYARIIDSLVVLENNLMTKE